MNKKEQAKIVTIKGPILNVLIGKLKSYDVKLGEVSLDDISFEPVLNQKQIYLTERLNYFILQSEEIEKKIEIEDGYITGEKEVEFRKLLMNLEISEFDEFSESTTSKPVGFNNRLIKRYNHDVKYGYTSIFNSGVNHVKGRGGWYAQLSLLGLNTWKNSQDVEFCVVRTYRYFNYISRSDISAINTFSELMRFMAEHRNHLHFDGYVNSEIQIIDLNDIFGGLQKK